MNTFHDRTVSALACMIAISFLGGCGTTDPYYYGGYPSTVSDPCSGRPVSQPGEMVKKYHWYGRVPSPGSPVPGLPNTVWGNPNPDGFGGGDGEVLPAVGWRWADPAQLGDKRVIPAR